MDMIEREKDGMGTDWTLVSQSLSIWALLVQKFQFQHT